MMFFKYRTLAAVVLLSGSLLAQSASMTVSLSPKAWTTYTQQFFTKSGTPIRSFALSSTNGALSFVFPDQAVGDVSYLYTTGKHTSLNLSHAQSLTAQFSIAVLSGAPSIVYLDNGCPGVPARARLFFWANGNGSGEFDRWWSDLAYADIVWVPLDSTTLFAALDPSAWSSVYGKSGMYDAASAAGWAQALQHVSSIGLTFGGGCFYGHGVFTQNGQAQFLLTDYQVN